jgi:hypothetical protein
LSACTRQDRKFTSQGFDVNALIGIFACGTLALFLANDAFRPVERSAVILILSVIWFAGASILAWAKKNDDGDDADSYWPRKRYLAVSFLPWLMCAVISANAILDSSAAMPHRTLVVARSKGRYGSSITVRSWRAGHLTESISVSGLCYETNSVDTPVTVTEKNGALGMHWINEVSGCSR